jgi:hypothetical protein
MQEVRCRWSPTLGSLEDTAEAVWGIKEYVPDKDIDKPTVFFGLYGVPDFYALWRHKGKRWILWAGSDIRHFVKGYWLEDGGEIKIDPRPLAKWISKYCESWVENEVEYRALKELGIESKICPSFLGDIKKFPLSYAQNDRPKLYTSVSGDNFELYGWDKIDELAEQNPNVEFHLYGNTKEWRSDYPNVIVHGRVSKEQINEETKDMQGALRLTEFDGFSEILAKSLLMGQWPVSEIGYPHTLRPDQIGLLKHKEANVAGRDYYLKTLNKYPWAK